MGLFYNYNKSGKGVAKNAPQKRPFFRFWDIFLRKFWKFFEINLIYVLFCLPVVTFGPATAAMTSIMRNFTLEKPQFIFTDFVAAFKKNFKQSFLIGIIDIAFAAAFVFTVYFYTVNMDKTDYYWLMYAVALATGIIFIIMHFYIYLQIVATNLTLMQILKNSLVFTCLGLGRNMITLVFFGAFFVLFYFMSLYLLPLLLILPFAWLSFLSVFCCYPIVQKYVISPYYEARGEKNPELPEESDEAVFEDKGGSESEIVIKKPRGKGKLIK